MNVYSGSFAVQQAAKGEVIADTLASFASQGGSLGNILRTTGNAQRKMDHNLNILAGTTKENVAVPIAETCENGTYLFFSFSLFSPPFPPPATLFYYFI
jgi:hypothetical protein